MNANINTNLVARITLVALLAITSLSPARAQDCVARTIVPIVNSATGYQKTIMGTPDVTLETKFWIVGAGEDNNSGSLTTTTMLTGNGQDLPGLSFPWSNWGNAGVNVSWPHPSPACDRMAFLYSFQDGDRSYYLVMSTAAAYQSIYDFDMISNGPGNVLNPVELPRVRVKGFRRNADNSFDLTVQWERVTDRKGYYDVEPADVVTGASFYYRLAPFGQPVTELGLANWTLAQGGPNERPGYVTFENGDPGITVVRIPALTPGAAAYVSMGLLFDGAKPGSFQETSFVGKPTGAIVPSHTIIP